MGRFDGKVAIITGSSTGIGRATAVLFAKEGAKITITGRNLAALAETKAECIKAGAKESEILVTSGDMMEEETRKELIDKTLDKFGKLDILVSNHGGAFIECKEDGSWNIDTFDSTFNQNTKSTLDLCLKAEPHLKKTKGDIVLVSSIGADMAVTWNPFYAMAKISLCHLTSILGYRLAKDGVRVNCVKPGFIVTPFYSRLGFTPELTEKVAQFHANRTIPMGRTGTCEEIAEPIAFLADRKVSGYMTGQSITVDGGVTLQHGATTYSFEDIMKQNNP
uniref:3-oxoacyl-[acyl-carrier-protein reductase n=1 Tax=Ascaris suum TaxID=6253 RepID=F1LD98_ASCSU